MAAYYSKAEKAAIIVKNIKVERLNDFYTDHKEVIEEFFRLQKEVSNANMDEINATMNTLNERFPSKKK